MNREQQRVCVVKLGGSLITDKTQPGRIHDDRIARLGAVLAQVAAPTNVADRARLVVIMGGGSVGHNAARLYGVDRGLADCDRARLHRMPVDMFTLKGAVAGAIGDAGGSALPLHEMSLAQMRADGLRLSLEPILATLERGFTPILSGGLIFDDVRGIRPLNGDCLPIAMIESGRIVIDRVVMLSDVPGLIDRDGHVVSRVGASDRNFIRSCLRPLAPGDVTGGMGAKVDACLAIAALGIPCVIAGGIDLDAAGLAGLLSGKAEGSTSILPEQG